MTSLLYQWGVHWEDCPCNNKHQQMTHLYQRAITLFSFINTTKALRTYILSFWMRIKRLWIENWVTLRWNRSKSTRTEEAGGRCTRAETHGRWEWRKLKHRKENVWKKIKKQERNVWSWTFLQICLYWVKLLLCATESSSAEKSTVTVSLYQIFNNFRR